MAWFRCFIRGENFPGALIGEPGLVGFYITRFIEAANPGEAESLVVQQLRAEPRLAPPDGHRPSGMARVYFEEITELPGDQQPAQQPGFTWYAMGSDS